MNADACKAPSIGKHGERINDDDTHRCIASVEKEESTEKRIIIDDTYPRSGYLLY